MLVRTNYINIDTLSSTLTNQFSKYVNGLLFTNAESDSMNGILNFNFGCCKTLSLGGDSVMWLHLVFTL